MIYAKPLSTYHLSLLKHNDIIPDVFIVSKNTSKLTSLIQKYFGSITTIEIDSEFFSFNFFKSYYRNKRFYEKTKKKIFTNDISKLILFTDNKPLDKFFFDQCLQNNIDAELWEDGLGHYIGGGTNKYKWKALLKLFSGYYSKRIFQEQYNRRLISVKDRFENKNLVYKSTILSESFENKKKAIFIGQALIQDGYITKGTYISKINGLKKVFDLEVDYLPHPRQNITFEFDKNVHILSTNLSAEEYCLQNEYDIYISAFSTALMNIDKYDKSYYIPSYFNLKLINKRITNLPFLPVKIIEIEKT